MKLNKLLFPCILFSFLSVTASEKTPPAVDKFTIDPVHSAVIFRVDHAYTPVIGTFSDFRGNIWFDKNNLAACKIEAEVNVDSIDTRNDMRDQDLKSKRFFDQSMHPKMIFKSTAWKSMPSVIGNRYWVEGTLTLMSKTLPITLEVEWLGSGPAKAPLKESKTVSGWVAHTKINRQDWGMDCPIPGIGVEVSIEVNIEADLDAPTVSK